MVAFDRKSRPNSFSLVVVFRIPLTAIAMPNDEQPYRCQRAKYMNWEFSGARNNVLAGWHLPASWHPLCSSDLQNVASSRCCSYCEHGCADCLEFFQMLLRSSCNRVWSQVSLGHFQFCVSSRSPLYTPPLTLLWVKISCHKVIAIPFTLDTASNR